MKNSCCLILVGFLMGTVSFTFGQGTEPDSVFGEVIVSEPEILKTNDALAKAHETWTLAVEKATEKYTVDLETFYDREKGRNDLDFAKALEKLLETVKERGATPCILYDPLPQKAQKYQADFNKAKSRANKNFLAAAEKLIKAAVKQKKIEEAKEIETFLYSSFLPPSFRANFPSMVLHENKLLYYHDYGKNWAEAYDWCRARNGNLACIRDEKEQTVVVKLSKKTEWWRIAWTGGAKVNGNWIWSDGTPFNPVAWAKGEPSGGKQNRVTIDYGRSGNWDDREADDHYGFFVQWTLY